MTYDELAILYDDLIIKEVDFSDFDPEEDLKGLCIKNKILIRKDLKTTTEKTCILAEELGHFFTTVGNIIDQSKIENRKQEEKARRWAVRRIASLMDFISAFEAGCRTKEEFVDHINITEEFLHWSIDYYKKRYGLMTTVDRQYAIYFEPFMIMKLFKEEGE